MTTDHNKVAGVILAAGKGTRMKSDLPKVLHPLLGKPLLQYVLNALSKSGVEDICLILGGDLDNFSNFLKVNKDLTICIQESRRGTADAVASAYPALNMAKKPNFAKGSLSHGQTIDCPYLLICCGDTPALSHEILNDFINTCLENNHNLGVIGMENPDPTGYGRLLIDEDQKLQKIVEEKDADGEIKKIKLCNSGIIFAETAWLFELLDEVKPNNSQNEYYLTDCFELSQERGEPAYVYTTKEHQTFDGINDQEQLRKMEDWFKTAHMDL